MLWSIVSTMFTSILITSPVATILAACSMSQVPRSHMMELPLPPGRKPRAIRRYLQSKEGARGAENAQREHETPHERERL